MLCNTLVLFGALIQTELQPQYNPAEPTVLDQINGVITIDGYVDEPAWDLIPPLPLISYVPVSGLPPSESPEIRIAYDDHFISASIRAFDSDPSGIRANTLYRDRLSGDDVFHILLDTY